MVQSISQHLDSRRLEIEMLSDIENLVKKVECLEDYEQASQALMEIVRREPESGSVLAMNLLRSNAGDVHLRAFAFSMLYRANRTRAFGYIRENSQMCEPAVFLAMLSEVAEDVGLVNESSELRQMVAFLRESISYRSDRQVDVVQRGVEEFLSTYSDLAPETPETKTGTPTFF